MQSPPDRHLHALLHPYVFILKEGAKIQDDLLDYRLMMLHVHCHEIIRTPKLTTTSQSAPVFSHIEALQPLTELPPFLG